MEKAEILPNRSPMFSIIFDKIVGVGAVTDHNYTRRLLFNFNDDCRSFHDFSST
jgi:hypothetical protein